METDVSIDGEQHLLTGAYALDALDASEREAFEEHLGGCETCRAEVRELLATAALLGLAAAEPPPSGLKERVLAEVDRTRQDPPVVTAAESGALPDNVVALTPRRAGRIFQLAAAVITVIAVGLGVWGIQAHQRSGRLNDKIAAINNVLAAPDAQVVHGALQGGVSGQATIVVSRHLGRTAFVGEGLSRLPSNRTYELWYINADGSARPAGLLDVGSRGKATQLLSGPVEQASTVGVTVEPSGGSKQPTSNPVLAVNL
jgi:anti-sigma-K factor RskA